MTNIWDQLDPGLAVRRTPAGPGNCPPHNIEEFKYYIGSLVRLHGLACHIADGDSDLGNGTDRQRETIVALNAAIGEMLATAQAFADVLFEHAHQRDAAPGKRAGP